MPEPKWAQRARELGLNLEEVKQGLFVFTKESNHSPADEDESPERNPNSSATRLAKKETKQGAVTEKP